MADLPDLAETITNLRREVGPTGVGEGRWQPMVMTCELWVLLDRLEALEPDRPSVIAQQVARGATPPHPATMAGRRPPEATCPGGC